MSSISRGGSLSSKSITVTQCIYPLGMLLCPSPVFCGPEPNYVCIFDIISRKTAVRYRKCQGRELFLTAGLDSSIPSLFSFFFLFISMHAACSSSPPGIIPSAGWVSAPPLSPPCPAHFHTLKADKSQGVRLFHLT